MSKKYKCYIVNTMVNESYGDRCMSSPIPIAVIAKTKREAVNAATTYLTLRKKETSVAAWMKGVAPLMIAEEGKVTHVNPKLTVDAENILRAVFDLRDKVKVQMEDLEENDE